jgi:translation initiation factor IF-1
MRPSAVLRPDPIARGVDRAGRSPHCKGIADVNADGRIRRCVVEVLPDGRVRVQMDNGHAIVAYTAGRMKRNRIRMTAGDRVTVEMTPYDLNKGRVVFRHKTGPAVRFGPAQGGHRQARAA